MSRLLKEVKVGIILMIKETIHENGKNPCIPVCKKTAILAYVTILLSQNHFKQRSLHFFYKPISSFVYFFKRGFCKLVPKIKAMATSDLKQKVLEYVQEADEPLLQLMEALAEDYLRKEPSDSVLSEEQWQNVAERWEKHQAGESNSYTWEEVKKNIKEARRNGF